MKGQSILVLVTLVLFTFAPRPCESAFTEYFYGTDRNDLYRAAPTDQSMTTIYINVAHEINVGFTYVPEPAIIPTASAILLGTMAQALLPGYADADEEHCKKKRTTLNNQ